MHTINTAIPTVSSLASNAVAASNKLHVAGLSPVHPLSTTPSDEVSFNQIESNLYEIGRYFKMGTVDNDLCIVYTTSQAAADRISDFRNCAVVVVSSLPQNAKV
jgi:hypothetical protein